MGGYSIPSIMPSQVLSGALARHREYQEADLKEHRQRRDAYIAHLGQLMNVARDDGTIKWLSDEIVRAEETPDEKLAQFKGKPMPVPMHLQSPEVKAQAAAKASGASTPGAGAGAGTGATPPPFDFSHVMAAITGQPAPGTEDQGGDQSAGAPASVGATPPSPVAGMGGPFTGATPQLVPSGPPPTPSVPTSANGLPSVAMTPPGHSVPEPSPMVGTLPGTPSPGQGGGGGAVGSSMAGGTSMTPPSMPSSVSAAATPTPTPTAAPTPVTPPEFVPRFMGLQDKLDSQAAAKAAAKDDKSDPTPANMVAAARAHQVFQEAPDGTYFLRPMTKAELSLLDTSKLDTDQAHIHSIQMQDTLRGAQTRLTNLKSEGLTPGTPQYEAAKSFRERALALQSTRMSIMQHNSERGDVTQEAALWGTAHGVPVPGALVDPSTGQTLGLSTPQAKMLQPTVLARNKADQGRIIINQGNDLIRLIHDNEDAFGAWDGRVNLARKDLGISDPTVREIYTRLRSYAALQPQLHGARGVGYQIEFEDAVGKLKENPDAVVASLNALNSLAGEFVAQVGNVQYAKPSAGAGAGAGAGATPPPVTTKPAGATNTSTSTDHSAGLSDFHTNKTTGQRIGRNSTGQWIDTTTGKPVWSK